LYSKGNGVKIIWTLPAKARAAINVGMEGAKAQAAVPRADRANEAQGNRVRGARRYELKSESASNIAPVQDEMRLGTRV
jgi:hypothetical protein